MGAAGGPRSTRLRPACRYRPPLRRPVALDESLPLHVQPADAVATWLSSLHADDFPYDAVVAEFHRAGKHFVATEVLEALAAAREALPEVRGSVASVRLLEAHEPNPALIVDGLWNLIESNRAASLLWDGVDPALLEPPINMLRLGVHPGGLPRISSMTAACNAPLIHRLKRRSREDADPALAALVETTNSTKPAQTPTELDGSRSGLSSGARARTRTSTTVLATDSVSPNIIAGGHVHPNQ